MQVDVYIPRDFSLIVLKWWCFPGDAASCSCFDFASAVFAMKTRRKLFKAVSNPSNRFMMCMHAFVQFRQSLIDKMEISFIDVCSFPRHTRHKMPSFYASRLLQIETKHLQFNLHRENFSLACWRHAQSSEWCFSWIYFHLEQEKFCEVLLKWYVDERQERSSQTTLE